MKVIFGATGKVGGTAARELRQQGLSVRAVLRQKARGGRLAAAGCELAEADLHDGEAVTRSLAGASAVLVICPLPATAEDVGGEVGRLLATLGEAIARDCPPSVIVVSDYGAHHAAGTGLTLLFHALEARLRSLPAAVTFVRSAEQMENWARHLPLANQRGVLPSLHLPLDRPFPLVSAPDVGALAARLLAEPPGPAGAVRVIHAEGPRRHSAAEIAGVMGQILERPVTPLALARERWVPALTAAGLSESYASLIAALQDAHNAGRIEVEPGGEVWRGQIELAEALGRAARVAAPAAAG